MEFSENNTRQNKRQQTDAFAERLVMEQERSDLLFTLFGPQREVVADVASSEAQNFPAGLHNNGKLCVPINIQQK